MKKLYRFRVWIGYGNDYDEVIVGEEFDHEPTDEEKNRIILEGIDMIYDYGVEVLDGDA